MLILGIETSCDETAASVVQDGRSILSNVVLSQIDRHQVFGGVVPEIACRLHEETLLPVIEDALNRANLTIKDIEAIAVTYTPGLVGALLIGVACAKTLAYIFQKPLLAINHLYAHAYASVMASQKPDKECYPHVALVASGGHTSLFYASSPTCLRLLGRTIDDAAGEAFDKVARILGLPYPGGPAIERAAQGIGVPIKKIDFTMPSEQDLDFSFSGIKTAVLYHVCGRNQKGEIPRPLSTERVRETAAAFQEMITDILCAKTLYALKKWKVPSLAVSGGVACNERLRNKFARALPSSQLLIPPKSLCVDNAAMIAGLAYHEAQAEHWANLDLDAEPLFREK